MTMSQQTTETAGTIAVKTAPPLGFVGAHLAGMSIADWVQWATLVYVLMMIAHKGWHMWKEWQTGKEVGDDA